MGGGVPADDAPKVKEEADGTTLCAAIAALPPIAVLEVKPGCCCGSVALLLLLLRNPIAGDGISAIAGGCCSNVLAFDT